MFFSLCYRQLNLKTMKLLNKQWYRNLFSERTFVEVDNNWINIKNYKTGKITNVDGKWDTMAFCECGNELVHSNSFLQERKAENRFIFDYKCSFCGRMQYWNPDIIPGLISCTIDGTPL